MPVKICDGNSIRTLPNSRSKASPRLLIPAPVRKAKCWCTVLKSSLRFVVVRSEQSEAHINLIPNRASYSLRVTYHLNHVSAFYDTSSGVFHEESYLTALEQSLA